MKKTIVLASIFSTALILFGVKSASALDISSGVSFGSSTGSTVTKLNLSIDQRQEQNGITVTGNLTGANVNLDNVGNLSILGQGLSGAGSIGTYRINNVTTGSGTQTTVTNDYSNTLKAFSSF